MYVTSRGASHTGLPFVLPVSVDKIDNNFNKYAVCCVLFSYAWVAFAYTTSLLIVQILLFEL